jgi:hypothetical protein
MKVAAIAIVASFTVVAAALSNLSHGEQTQIIEKAREIAHVGANKLHMIAAFDGSVYVDRETYQIMRITHTPSGIPSSWPIVAISSVLDYGFAEIGGQKVLLPLRAELNVTLRDGSQARNVMDFANYRKFTSDAVLKFEP